MTLELLPGFIAHPERFVYHAASGTAVLADLHLGFETALAQSAGITPDFSVMTRQWQAIAALRPQRVVLAGDVFHKASLAAESVELLTSWFNMLPAAAELFITPGNHDPAMRDLRALFGARVSVIKMLLSDHYAVAHGHDLEVAERSGRVMIVGHQHPAVMMADRIQSAKMICFAWAPKLIILPAFSPLPIGVSLLTQRKWILDCPLPAADQLMIAGIVRDQVLNFGPLSGLST